MSALSETQFTCLEVCAGAGGTALGLEHAGFAHLALVEIDQHACRTLRSNRPEWSVIESDVHVFSAEPFAGVDLISAGVPCPPFSVAGRQLGADDERDLFPEILRLVKEARPRALFVENVRGLLSPVFDDYRKRVDASLVRLGYLPQWQLVKASDFGVPQLRPRAALVALLPEVAEHFSWPAPLTEEPPTVGEALRDEMASCGWGGAQTWASQADSIAPTLVGGSKKHGGPDLGPTRARRAWAKLGVEGRTIAEDAPHVDFEGMPRLTVQMAALIQGFPRSWVFEGRKTNAYRQVGNAFPPPVAKAIGVAIRDALARSGSIDSRKASTLDAIQLAIRV